MKRCGSSSASSITARGIPHEAHIYPGGHDWQFVMDHFAAALTVVAKDIGAR